MTNNSSDVVKDKATALAILQSLWDKCKEVKIKKNSKGCYLEGDDGNTYIMDCEYGNCEHAGWNSALTAIQDHIREQIRDIEV